MADFSKHDGVVILLKEAQDAETDLREKVREVQSFLHDPQGQWEDHIWSKHGENNRPRYTFDRCNEIVDDIAGEMEQADFDIRVKPAGGDATKELAKTYDGLIRNIENLSNAIDVFNSGGRSMIEAGFDCWRVNQRWGENDSFDQDLFIDDIPDAVDSVWFDPNAKKKTREDAGYCFILERMVKRAYQEQFPDGEGKSLSTDGVDTNNIDGMPDQVIVGEILYKVEDTIEIVEMTNGAIYKADEKFAQIVDDLAAQGITVKRTRKRKVDKIKTRLFDGGGWLSDVQDTVFEYLPVVPTYGNFKAKDGAITYSGVITKKMDAQRVLNYTESRKVEEGALAPLDKIIVTDDQIGVHTAAWTKLNTSQDPALIYEHQDGQPPPYKIGGAQLNPGLETVSQSMQSYLQSTAGLDRLTGEPLGIRSGTAVELEQNKGDTRNYKYSVSQEIAICHTAKILIRAIPKVYDTDRIVRILNEDDSFELIPLNHQIVDEDTGQVVTINDLSQGIYDVTCTVGPAFKNRQEETVSALNELAQIDPTILEDGKDIYLQNITTPGADLIAERVRQRMLMEGRIPQEQMTDEEKELLANQEPQPDPVAEALAAEAQNNEDNVQIRAIEAARKDRELEHKIAQDQRAAESESMKAALELIQKAAEELNTQANTFKVLREASAVEGASDGPLIGEQLNIIADSQAEQS